MALMSVDGQDNAVDNVIQRQGFGTIGGDHMVPSSIGGTHTNSVITIFDPRVQYASHGGGALGWQLQAGLNAFGWLSYSAHASYPGAGVTVNFTGSKISVIGSTLPSGGRLDVYIDGNLATGAVNTSTPLSVQYYTSGTLNKTDTTIMAIDTTNFPTSGTLLIDAEEITYTGISGSTFTGCTRGANGTVAANHTAATTINYVNSMIELYSPYIQDRVTLWRKNNLAPGNHTLVLQIRADHNSSSTSTYVNLNGFVAGSMVGASNIPTTVRYIDTGNITTDANGVYSNVSILAPDTAMQLLAVTSAYPVSGAAWAFPMYNPNSDTLSIATNAASTSVRIILTCLFLGASI